MKIFILKSILLFFLVLPQLKAFQPPSAIANITFYTENYPPANYLINDELKGISVDTLKAIWKNLDIPEQKVLLVPWARGYKFTLDKSNTALFTMSKTQPREKLFKWVGPFFHSTHVLIAKKSKNFNFSNLQQVFNHTVAAVKDDISGISLHKMGFPASNLAEISQLEQAFLLMQSDRVDMMVTSIHAFEHLAKKNNLNTNAYKQVWQVNKTGNYLVFNINTPDHIIQSYQRAFDNIAKQRLTIKQQYELSPAEY
ncbi:transporter substrate-binding domain-containing protein [Colwellia sp. MB02u-10]|jgi:polar amino acid transport system substrate-binding protein|uniref:substrate-binding periplasmic protein n=1 Tax=Colwellia sp. MB02u-10 TaxID=2759828 RepID=UPI0015F730CA|nr:transporter substrate-binding domain-containing protein [Colwellia sp. MB02u-10]MBA6341015.1 transporter substrate-binding domain-containing protein [Colwellia sp. MB02u-10]